MLMLVEIMPKVMEVVKMMALKMCPIPGDTYGLTNYSLMPQKAVSTELERKENRKGNMEKSLSLCRTELSLWLKK